MDLHSQINSIYLNGNYFESLIGSLYKFVKDRLDLISIIKDFGFIKTK